MKSGADTAVAAPALHVSRAPSSVGLGFFLFVCFWLMSSCTVVASFGTTFPSRYAPSSRLSARHVATNSSSPPRHT